MSDPPKEDTDNAKATGSGTVSRESVKEIVMEVLRGLQDPPPKKPDGSDPDGEKTVTPGRYNLVNTVVQ